MEVLILKQCLVITQTEQQSAALHSTELRIALKQAKDVV